MELSIYLIDVSNYKSKLFLLDKAKSCGILIGFLTTKDFSND